MRRVLCRLDDIADPGAKGFVFGEGTERREVFVVRNGAAVHAYENSCPHIGTPLDFLPDQFLTRDATQIRCSTHGARFEIASGRCVSGPCKGDRLTQAPVRLEAGAVVLIE